ncbi:unnamed protein product [Penicillium bialowiezense]
MELISPAFAGNTYTPTALGKRAQSPPATAAPYTTTIIWGVAGIVFGIVTIWSQIATYLLTKEKWAIEKPNLLGQIAESQASTAQLEAERAIVRSQMAQIEAQTAVTTSEVQRLITARLEPIETDITHLLKVANQDE